MTLSARFSVRGMVAGVALTLALIAAVVLSADATAVIREPPILLAPMLLVVSSAMLSTALMRSDIDHRGEALIDPLTGMLNRNALARRAEELRQQSDVSGDPVGVIVADIDHFKRINDWHGHAAGDAVLRDVAYLLRKHLRAFESAYRLGGEEFLFLLPGADLASAFEHAERLRRVVAAQAIGDGQHVTISFGVAASGRSTVFDYEAVSSEADIALYDAKRAGRNRVCAWRPPTERPSKTLWHGSSDPAAAPSSA
jgi:diguanylate cyclase (GGDEF)-like protein